MSDGVPGGKCVVVLRYTRESPEEREARGPAAAPPRCHDLFVGRMAGNYHGGCKTEALPLRPPQKVLPVDFCMKTFGAIFKTLEVVLTTFEVVLKIFAAVPKIFEATFKISG